MKRITTMGLLLTLIFLTTPDDVFSQDETVIADTLISIGDDGKKRIKIITKKMKGSQGMDSLELKQLLDDDNADGKVFFFGDDDGETRLRLKGFGDELNFDFDFESLLDGPLSLLNDSENVFWMDSGDGFSGNMEVMKMEMESKKLARQIRKEDNTAKKAELEADLHTLLIDIFDTKQESMEQRLEEKIERLEEEREELRERKSKKDQMLEDRKAELLKSKSKKLRW